MQRQMLPPRRLTVEERVNVLETDLADEARARADGEERVFGDIGKVFGALARSNETLASIDRRLLRIEVKLEIADTTGQHGREAMSSVQSAAARLELENVHRELERVKADHAKREADLKAELAERRTTAQGWRTWAERGVIAALAAALAWLLVDKIQTRPAPDLPAHHRQR